MKKLSRKQRQHYLDVIAAIPDDAIDTSDIPELTEEQLRGAVRGMFYRPLTRRKVPQTNSGEKPRANSE